jgi:hypothetical protein
MSADVLMPTRMNDAGERRSLNLFHLLASVEVSLILQFLDNASKLAAAVTCKRVMADALQPFSWKYANMVCITDAQLLKQQNRVHPSYSLLQLAPVHLLLKSPCIDPELLSLSCIRRLYKLEIDEYHTSDISALLAQPSVIQKLRQLKLSHTGELNFVCISKASELTSLSVSCGSCSHPRDLFLSHLKDALAQMLKRPQLTELVMRGLYYADITVLQPLLQSSSHLRRLHLYGDMGLLNVHHSAKATLFSSLGRSLSHLEVLSLGGFSVRHLSTDIVLQFFASLHAVHTLQLCYCPAVSMLLPLVATAAMPRLVHLLIFSWARPLDDHFSIPSSEALATLQETMPHLCITTGRWNGIQYDDYGTHRNFNMDKLLFVTSTDRL